MPSPMTFLSSMAAGGGGGVVGGVMHLFHQEKDQTLYPKSLHTVKAAGCWQRRVVSEEEPGSAPSGFLGVV